MQNIKNYMLKSKDERINHLDLSSKCILRGTNSTHCRGILAYFLDTTLNDMNDADCCHACNNPDCSNPRHLYWGTRSENMQDAFRFNPERKMKSARFGKDNPNFNVNPWRSSAIKIHENMKNSWKKALYFYNNYYLKNWNYSMYGQGETYFNKKYGVSRSSISVMFRKFKEDWNPEKDEDFLEWLKTNS